MKKIVLFLMIMTIHHSAYALDEWDNLLSYFTDATKYTDDPKYTIDKRKYVSRDKAPFSAVVGLKYSGGQNWCSGTLTADGIVVTAKHCIFDGDTNRYKPSNNIIINSTKGDTGVRTWRASGRDIYPDSGYDDTYDWALLAPKANIKSTVNVSKLTAGGTGDVIVAGYGALKILSDQEIRKIRQEYAKWLNRGVGTNIAPSSGVDLESRSSFGSQFVREIKAGQINGIPADTFKDTHRLKVSLCHATLSNSSHNQINCQVWGGNSGGPVFYKHKDKWYLYGTAVSAQVNITNSRDTYAKGAHMVPINMFIKSYRKFINDLRGTK